jgi:hypothetical protein
MMSRPAKRIYLFDTFRVDAAERLLFKENREVPLTSTVKDLVAGSGLDFDDRGIHDLLGCGEWRLFAVKR